MSRKKYYRKKCRVCLDEFLDSGKCKNNCDPNLARPAMRHLSTQKKARKHEENQREFGKWPSTGATR